MLRFTPHPSNPQFTFGQFGGLVWNDPSVLRDGAEYRLWLSAGAGRAGVRIYEARSGDGIEWRLQSSLDEPQLAPGPAPWDAVSVETPSVIKVGGSYHLYYTAVPDEGFTNYQIGHAASSDGIRWQKDPQPVIAKAAAPNEWGWLGVAEPGVTYKDGIYYLYYAMVRCREGFAGGTCTGGPPAVVRGIGLATSTDGRTFRPDPANPIHVQTPRYPASALYEGYSTPAALVSDGAFYLFYDVAQVVDGGFRQVAIAYATSRDGRRFNEDGPDVLVRDPAGWTAWEIRSPTIIREGGRFEMWFAGNSSNDPRAPGFQIGIGRASSEPGCP